MFNIPRTEEYILKFWERKDIFKKSIKQRKNANNFIFYEGPPTANAKPGLHHVLARAYKDVICRYKTMQGFKVLRRAGWDTHGLPVELEIEKKLGLKSKKDIENYGIAKFNRLCRNSVWNYKKDWEKLTERIGFWLDMKNSYITSSAPYMESVFNIIKQISDKGLLYQDYKVVPYCPRCGTGLSSHEVAQGYKKIKEPAIYIKFKILNSKFQINPKSKIQNPKFYFLVWTTTPWTLPGNVAIAVNSNITYVLAHSERSQTSLRNEYLIIAKERKEVLGEDFKVAKEFKGKELVGLVYEPLFKREVVVPPQETKNIYKILSADFVNTKEGTGLVHIAPAFGQDDMDLIKEQNTKNKNKNKKYPVLMTVDQEGKFKEEVKKWKGLFVKKADPLIVEYLQEKGSLFKKEQYEHDYPFCWRCKSPLLYYAKKGWFIKMSVLRDKLLKNNEQINWVPSHLKQGRFGEWLREVKDWNLSRERYWGIPLPIWKCQQCDKTVVIGSMGELRQLQINNFEIQDLHRPYIDEINFSCSECKGIMKRVPEVIDCWFDSGAMPFAQEHWPFTLPKNQKLKPPKLFPADYISEGIDQTRGWFYTLLAISTLLNFSSPYKNIISLGHILDEKGEKMSKSKGNVVDPWQVIEKYGADALRWYFFTVNQSGDEKRFSERRINQALKKFILTFWNSFLFFETYKEGIKPQLKTKNLLNRWIISRLNELIQQVTEKLDKYNVTGAARAIENFVINDLSLWYIRRSRKRFKEAAGTLAFVLQALSKLTAPFIPFLSENINQAKKSVHLQDWPKVNKKLIDKKLEEKMEKVREICSLGLRKRAEAGIKVRQPIALLKIKNQKASLIHAAKIKNDKELLELIKDEINVKEIIFDSKIKEEVEIDTKITPELKEEGMIREIIRKIQEMRKKAGLMPQDKIKVYFSDKQLQEIIEKNKEQIKKQAIIDDLEFKKTKEKILIKKL